MKTRKAGGRYFGRLEKGEEIVESLTAFCKENYIRNGMIYGIGAAEKLTLGYYDPVQKKYINREFNGDYEITSLLGNISLLKGEPFFHLHINLSDSEFHTYGGHLFSGVVSLTCEFVIIPFDTDAERKPDSQTGLNLIDF